MNLTKEMPRIAARVLKNTRCFHPDMKGRLALVAEAYGAMPVARDFEEWCISVKDDHVQYPISEYLKLVDSRLGAAPEPNELDLTNPKVQELISKTYELTGVLPSAKSVAEVLAIYTYEETEAALVEFTEGLTERELKSSIRNFYANGGSGAAAVISARRRRDGKK